MYKLQRECHAVCICIESQGPAQDVRGSILDSCEVTERDRATTHNKDMITMLRDLRQHISTERAARIDNLLASVSYTHKRTKLLTD